MPITSIITVNYNQPQATLEFLQSIHEHTACDEVEVILVDNGSTIDHGEDFLRNYSGLKYIRSHKNLGFAGGNNLGIKSAKGDFLLFLNNDTEISKNFIKNMIAEFDKKPDIGILSPLILYYEAKDRVQYAGFTQMNYFTGRNKALGFNEVNVNQYDDKSYETAYIHGAAMMCRSSDLTTIGLMDENYFLYYEELDWCEKFKNAGKKMWFTGNAQIFHKESISVGRGTSLKTYFLTRNRILFIRKNTKRFTTLIFYFYFIILACPKIIICYYLQGRKDLIPWIFKAVLWNFTNPTDSKRLGF